MKKVNILPPALNNEDFRKKQSMRVSEGIGDIGDFCKQQKKQMRINFIVGLTMSLIVLFILVLMVVTAYTTPGGFIQNLVDREALMRHINCSLDNKYTVFRSPTMAKDFITVFPNASCILKVNR